jgi:hypothetical protein
MKIAMRRGGWAVLTLALLFVVTIAAAAYVRPVPSSQASGRAFHASPAGTAAGDGSPARPLSLALALSANSPVLPGDTLWLHGGTYRGAFVSELRGTQAAPIVVRQAIGERATIDSGSTSIAVPTLYIKGAWTTYWDFEVMSSDPLRVIAEGGSQPASLKRGMGIDVHAPFTKLLNLVVHDLGDGIGLWSDAEGAEAYGNLVYYNGWSGADRAHGHGIYTQNQQGIRRISDNIIFSQFSHGIHAYGSDAAPLDYIELTGNIVFNNGALDRRYFDRNILLGGQRLATAPVLDSNYTYYSPGLRHGGENNIGYNAGCTGLVARHNYFAGQAAGGVPLRLSDLCTGLIADNMFYGALEPKIPAAYPNNEFTTTRPTGTRVFVRPHPYDRTRAHIAVYNWDRLPSVEIDLSSLGFDPGRPIDLRDAQNFFGAPLYSAPFGNGRITVPMRGATVAPPLGNVEAPPHTAPEFIALVAIGVPERRPLSDLAASTLSNARRVMERLWAR